MTDDNIIVEEEEAPVQYFCKFTFAQFFTIMVLAVFTLGFMFYLGARYGNDYLRLGESTEGSVATAAITTIPATGTVTDPERTDEMLRTAREVLQQQQAEKLQGQVAAVLQNPAAYQQQLAQQPPTSLPPGTVAPTVAPSGAVPPGAVTPQMAAAMQDQALAPVPQPAAPTTVQTASDRVNEYEAPAEVAAPAALPQPRAIPEQPVADDAPALPSQTAASTTFSVQVGASQDMTEANQWVQKWRERGYSAFMMVADLPEKGRWYRVRLGSFPSRGSAEAFAGQLKTKEQVDAIAVQNE